MSFQKGSKISGPYTSVGEPIIPVSQMRNWSANLGSVEQHIVTPQEKFGDLGHLSQGGNYLNK